MSINVDEFESVADDDIGNEQDVIIDADSSLTDKINQTIEQLGGTPDKVKMSVYCREPNNKWPWLFDTTLDDIPYLMEKLRDDFGGGHYDLRMFVDGRMRLRQGFDIKEPRKPKYPGESQVPLPSPSISPTDVLGMIQEMQKQNLDQIRMLGEQLKASAAQPSVSPMDMMSTMMTMMASMKDVMAPPQPVQERESPIAMLEQMLNLQQSLQAVTGDGGGLSSTAAWAGVAKEFLPKLAELGAASAQMEGLKSAQVERAKAKLNAPVSKPNPAHDPETGIGPRPVQPVQPVQPETKDTDQVNFIIKQALRRILPLAAKDSDIEVYANVILDQAELYGFADALHAFLKQENAMEKMVEIEPQTAEFIDWFAELRIAILEMYGFDETDDNLTGVENSGIGDTDINPPNKENAPSATDDSSLANDPEREQRDQGHAVNNATVSQPVQKRS